MQPRGGDGRDRCLCLILYPSFLQEEASNKAPYTVNAIEWSLGKSLKCSSASCQGELVFFVCILGGGVWKVHVVDKPDVVNFRVCSQF